MKHLNSIILTVLLVLSPNVSFAEVMATSLKSSTPSKAKDSTNNPNENIIAQMYPGLSQLISWGNGLSTDIRMDEDGGECLMITHSDPDSSDIWSAQFAYDYIYEVGETYYFTFDVKGDYGVVTSNFQNYNSYTTCGICDAFEITPEWNTVTISGTVEDTGEIVNRWVANIGDYEGTFFLRNMKIYTLVESPIAPPEADNDNIIAEMYPGPSRLFYWGDALSAEVVIDENGESLMITNSAPDPDDIWSAQFAYDHLYEIGKTYYFTFEVMGDYGVVTSYFQNYNSYTTCGVCDAFEINSEWKNITIKGTVEDTGEIVNRWVANIGDYEGTFYIRNMKIYTLGKNPFEVGEEFEYNKVRYAVIDPSALTCEVIATNSISTDINIPDVAIYNMTNLTVVEIGNKSFTNSSNLLSVSIPSTIEKIGIDAFTGCDRLTSLRWRGNRKMPAGVAESIGNPNLLVYVDSAKFAPEGLDHNVVADGVCEKLVLTPGYPFTPVSEFTAKTSSMTKEFKQVTGIGGCSGWETIVLPFDAVKVTSPEGHTLLPYSSVTDVRRQRPYWLYEADPAGEWQAAEGIKAGVPYLVSMPNNPRYNPAYNISGPVTFSNPKSQRIAPETTAPYAVTWASGREFRSLWLPLDEAQAAIAMGLNVNIDNLTDDNGEVLAPGSAFHVGIMPIPLEAYVTRTDASRAFRISGLQSAVSYMPEADGLNISCDGRTLLLKSNKDCSVEVYSADGTLLRRVDLKAGESVYVDSLPQGVCIIAGRKIMIR